MKKKLLFVIGNMETGGIQKSLSELLINIHNNYDITLCCIKKTGEYLKTLPDDIKICTAGIFPETTEHAASFLKKRNIFLYFLRLAYTLWAKFFGAKFPYFMLTRILGKALGSYDTAISFSQPLNDRIIGNITNEIVLNCCKATQKITFVHCDFEKYGGNCAYTRSLYRRFDKIACVSDSVGNKLSSCIPDVQNKIHTVYNMHSYDDILKMSEENTIEFASSPIVVTVARLSEEKGILRTLSCFEKLRKIFPQLQWHIAGDGGMRSSVEKLIKEKNLENTVILHGNMSNPYKLIKNADLFLLPSFHEAAPMVYAEAACLGIPILTTDTLSAKELVEIPGLGTVCENTTEGIYNGLIKMLTESKHISANKPDNSLAKKQFEYLIETEGTINNERTNQRNP